MANNADFSKIAGRLCIGDTDNGAENFLYFKSGYLREQRFCWVSDVRSSEIVPAWISSSLQQRAGDRRAFDIRWLGGVHSLGFLMAYYLLLLALRPLPRIARLVAALAGLWIFADVSYVAYFNSFYMDNAALLGAMVAIPAAFLLVSEAQELTELLLVFGAAALLFVTSKGQHGILGLVPAGISLFLGWRARGWWFRVVAGTTAVALLVGMASILDLTPDWYQGQARFNLVFFKILPGSSVPRRDAEQLGLTPDDLKYVGLHAFMPGNPTQDPNWFRSFCKRSNYGGVLHFYLMHPGRVLGILRSDLAQEAWQRRPVNLSNYRREDGHPAGARTDRLASWSAFRSWLFIHWSWHIAAWYALAILLGPVIALQEASPFNRTLIYVVVLTSLMGIVEFCIASLADACETYRHFLGFHLFTDVALFFGLVYGLSKTARRFAR